MTAAQGFALGGFLLSEKGLNQNNSKHFHGKLSLLYECSLKVQNLGKP
jgi:hypothetical protein